MPDSADSILNVDEKLSIGEGGGGAIAVVAVNGDSNLEAAMEFSRDEDLEKAVPEATAAKGVSYCEVIKEAVGEDPLVATITGAAGVAVATDSNVEVDDTL